MKLLLTAASLVVLAACDSGRRSFTTGPTTLSPPPVASPGPVGREPGPIRMNPTPLTPGASVDVTILADDPQCFPNWDSTGRCRQFEVTLPTDGTLVASVTLPVPDRGWWNPEVFIAAPDGDWREPEYGRTANSVSMSARAGLTYLVVVISYGPFPDVSPLSVEVRQ